MKTKIVLILLALTLILSGCSTNRYAKTPQGEFNGVLRVTWIGPDKFIFEPDAKRPFYFKRSNGEVIKPQRFYTDGGSIPRPLWIFKNYSPWGYGPAFIIHDWLFDAKHCGFDDAKNHTADTAADVMAEAIKTLMEADPGVRRSVTTFNLMDTAVRSEIAVKLWENGKCILPPEDTMLSLFGDQRKRFTQEYDFDNLK